MATITMTGQYPIRGGPGSFFTFFNSPEDKGDISATSTKIVAAYSPTPSTRPGSIQNVEFIGTGMDNTATDVWQGSVGELPWPSSGVVTSITVNFLGGSIRFEGTYDGAEFDRRAADYEFNWDDDLVSFRNFMFDDANTFIVDSNFIPVRGYDGDDTFYFTRGSGDLIWIEGGDGYDIANFQQRGRGVEIEWTSTSIERIVGSSRDDILYTIPDRFDEDLENYVYIAGMSIDSGSGNDIIYGTTSGDVLFGSQGNDIIYGDYTDYGGETRAGVYEGPYDDDIGGGSGNDILYGGKGNDDIRGGSGRDIIAGGGGADIIDGGSDKDTLTLAYSDPASTWMVNLSTGKMVETTASGTVTSTLVNMDFVIGSSNDDTITGTGVYNRLEGGDGNDTLRGAAGDDVLNGGRGDDALDGGSGADVLSGGLGADSLKGRSGADIFVFAVLADSPSIGRDRILDFDIDGGDVIDLSAIDANSNLDCNQSFAFLGTGAYTGAGGELRVSYRSSGDAVVTVDVDGDRVDDLNILLRDITAANPLTAGDFML